MCISINYYLKSGLSAQPHITVTDELLVRYLAGEAGPEEAMAVGEWLDTPANAAAFQQLQQVWNTAGPGTPYRRPDVSAEWERWHKQHGAPRPVRRIWPRWAAAAAVVLLAGGAWFLLQKNTTQEAAVYEAGLRQQRYALSDGSEATLEPGAQLTFGKTPEGERTAMLSGSGAFRVASDPEHPFTVQASPLTIRVVGTAFDIRRFTDSITVAVSEGAVMASGPADSMLLKAGMKGVYLLKAQRFSHNKPVSPGVLPSKTVFDFNDTPLGEVVQTLSRSYGIPVALDYPALANCRITAAFNDKPLDYVLTVITESLRLEYRKANDTVYIYGNACD